MRAMRASPAPGFGGASIELPLAISEQRTMTRLALYHATWAAEEISVAVYRAAGTTALRSGPLQLYFRDMHAGTQHVTSAPGAIENCGRALAGLAPAHRWLYMDLVPAAEPEADGDGS